MQGKMACSGDLLELQNCWLCSALPSNCTGGLVPWLSMAANSSKRLSQGVWYPGLLFHCLQHTEIGTRPAGVKRHICWKWPDPSGCFPCLRFLRTFSPALVAFPEHAELRPKALLLIQNPHLLQIKIVQPCRSPMIRVCWLVF